MVYQKRKNYNYASIMHYFLYNVIRYKIRLYNSTWNNEMLIIWFHRCNVT